MTGRPLLETVSRSICSASGANPDQPIYRGGDPAKGVLYLKWSVYREEAEAAIRACRVDELRTLLKRLEDCHLGDRVFDEAAVYEVWRDGQALLAKLDEKSV
jgi:hypothetical protein